MVQVRRVALALGGHESLRGYRIGHLSDLHIGPWTPRSWGLRWARAMNLLDPDLVVVTGDLIQTGDGYLEDAADVVGALRARDGVVVALGNHDYYGDTERLVRLLEARGVHVLRNTSRRTDRLLVAAVDDHASHRDDLDAALRDRHAGEPTILLAHDPAGLPAAAARDVDVVLSGHTHGGQLAMPFFARRLNLARLTRKHTLGAYRARRGTHLVVHPGLGTSGPPVRLGAAPALVEITLR
jgi:predicted MPP superfamily phosphohydrolase